MIHYRRLCLFMSRIFILLVAFIMQYAALHAGEPMLANDEIPGLKVARLIRYDEANLIDYLNDRAILYYEYGFEKLYKQTVILNDEVFQIEAAQMSENKGAFGLFSLFRNNCNLPPLDYIRNSCLNSLQITFSISNWYVSIANRSGSESAMLLSYKLAELIYNKSTKECFAPPAELNFDALQDHPSSLKFLNGTKALSIGMPDWSRFFKGIDLFSIYLYDFKPDANSSIKCALIKFMSGSDMANFLMNSDLGKGKKQKKKIIYKASGKMAVTIDSSSLYYIEYDGDNDTISSIINSIVK